MEYFEPGTVSEALSVLAKHGVEAKVIAGGTFLKLCSSGFQAADSIYCSFSSGAFG